MNFFFVVLTLFMISCESKSQTNSSKSVESKETKTVEAVFDNIDVKAAKALMSSNKELVLLDVRTPGEIAAGKIDGAIELDYQSPGFAEALKALDKNKEYLVYCAVGGRSGSTLGLMKNLGFTKAHNLSGGYSAWSSSSK